MSDRPNEGDLSKLSKEELQRLADEYTTQLDSAPEQSPQEKIKGFLQQLPPEIAVKYSNTTVNDRQDRYQLGQKLMRELFEIEHSKVANPKKNELTNSIARIIDLILKTEL